MANKLVDWVLEYIEEWRDHRDTNYLQDWKEYERLWRGEWAAEDRLRDSERSRITSPALQQAIENHTAEIEEAIFGQGDHLFDIEDDMMDPQRQDVEYLKGYMKESFKKNKLRKAVGDVTLLASIYGTGIGEIVLKKSKELVPATRQLPEVDAVAVGVEEKDKINVTLKPISPQNFLIDPTATSIEDALGVAIEEFVSAHKVAENVKAGVYKDTDIEDDSTPDKDLEPSWLDQESFDDKIKLIRYYGLVPAALLDATEDEVEDLFKEEKEVSELMEEYGDLVEAIVVIGNDDKLLKAERSPYMMKDRPVIAYQDDTVPNRFWGRGVAEKGYNMQKAIDAQLRSHLDSLALTTVPMMGMDATRLPRGSKFEIKPGKSVLTNGNPSEILMPFKFGQTDGGNIQTAQAFETMLLQATGTLDTQSTAVQPAGGELSITLSSILKKNKRTLVNFQDQFLIPFIEKSAWRFMQFDPENFPVKDWKFIPSSTLGMLAREVEQAQIINLLKTLGPDSPIVPILLQGVLANSSLPNRNALMAQVQQSMQPNPEQQQIQQAALQMQMQKAQADIAKVVSEVEVNKSNATKNMVETQLMPEETKAKLAAALSNNLEAGTADDKEFERRAKIADLMLKEKSINLKEQDIAQNAEIVKLQMNKKAKPQ
jgi:hypothetical protein